LSELKEITDGVKRLESKKMSAQRFEPSQEKSDYLSKLALTAKVERALRSRLSSQDAIWRPKSKRNDEKAAIQAA
jgi:hypothetical protein